MRRKIYKVTAGICLFVLLLSGCGGQESSVEKEEDGASSGEGGQPEIAEATQEIFAMDTYMAVTAYGGEAEEAVAAAIAEIERIDALLSTGDDASEVARINAGENVELSSDTAYLIERSLELYEKTGGFFDIAVYPIMEAWGFTTQEYRIPPQEELDGLLALADASDIIYDGEAQTISFAREGMKIDFGGIAKGYTSSRIMEIFEEYEVVSGLINLGGNVHVYGAKTDGSLWRVAIQSPEDESSYIGILSTKDKAVITSGGYERYFEEGGRTYHHIIDPATGYPAENGLVSVSIVSSDGTLADGLSTSLYIMGPDRAQEYWRAHSEEFDMILLTEDNVLYVSEGIADDFTSDLETVRVEK